MRTRGLMLAMLALVLKAALPAGFMLSQQSQGAPQIVLCTGHGAMALDPQSGALTPLDQADQQQDHQNKQDRSTQTCPFAALAFAAPAPSPVALPMARAPPEPVEAPSIVLATARSAGPPLPARGPPLHA